MKTLVLFHWICISVYGIEGTAIGNNHMHHDTAWRLTSKIYRESALVVLFDEKNGQSASEVSSLGQRGQRITLFSLQHSKAFLKQYIHRVLTTATSIEAIKDSLNVLVICSDCLHELLDMASATGDRVGQQALRHFSTWLFITQNEVSPLNTTFDNVAHIRAQDTNNPSKETSAEWCLETLLWMPGGRTWSKVFFPDQKYDDTFHSVFPNVRRGLNGRCLLVITMEWVPETMRKVVNGSVTYVGSTIDTIQTLSEVFNFTFKLIEPKDCAWGVQLDNGSWTGILGMMERQEADMTGNTYTFSVGRAQVMDFTPPYLTTTFVVIYTRRKKSVYFWTFLIAGFRWEVYVCGTVLFLCSVPVYSYITHITGDYRPEEAYQSQWKAVLLFTAIALRQDLTAHRTPHSWTEREFIFAWVFLCFLLTAIYSGSLVASATVDRLEVPFETLEDLVEQNEYTISVLDGHVALEVVKNSKLDVYQKLYKKMRNHILNPTTDYLTDGLNLVLHNSYALLSDLHTFRAMRALSCEVSVMRERLFYSPVSFGFPRQSPLKKLFHTRWMSDTGIFAESIRKGHVESKICTCIQKLSPNKMELKHYTTLFVVCVIGVGSGVVTLMLERRRFQRNKNIS